VLRAIRAAARNFERKSVIEMPRYWPSDRNDADDPITVIHGNTEFPSHRRKMVTMMNTNKRRRLGKRDRL